MDTIWKADLSGAGKSKYTALAAALRKAISGGVLTPGDRLPPVRELAYRTKVTPGTVARAYSLLIDEGLLEAGVGRGTFVATPGAVAILPGIWPETVSLRTPLLPEAGQTEILCDAMRAVADSANAIGLNRYPGRDNEQPLRDTIAAYLTHRPIGGFKPDDIVLTHGAQNAVLSVLQTVLTGADPVVLVEQHCYPGFRRAAELCRARVVAVECDENGPRPDLLEDLARRHRAQIFLTSAEVNNPTLRTTSAVRRREIAGVAHKLGLHVLDDDCYSHRQATAESYRALLPDLGWYVSSLSKTFSPALRIGWAIGPRARVGDLVRSVAFGCYGLATPLTETALQVLRDPRLPAVQDGIHHKMSGLIRTAVNHLGGHDVTWASEVPFLWISLPGGWRTSRFVRAAQDMGVRLKSSEDFVLRDNRAPHSVRIAVNGHIPPACFEATVDKLRDLLDNPDEELSV